MVFDMIKMNNCIIIHNISNITVKSYKIDSRKRGRRRLICKL